MIEIKAYKPLCCNKAMLLKSSALRHERKCKYNPMNKTCLTCKHHASTQETVYNPVHDGNPGSTDYEVEVNWCMKDVENPVNLTKDNEFTEWYTVNCDEWKQRGFEK